MVLDHPTTIRLPRTETEDLSCRFRIVRLDVPGSYVQSIPRESAKIVLVDEHDRVLLFCAADPCDSSRGRFWIVPGGGVEPGEAPREAALREVHEEVGLLLDADDLADTVLRRQEEFVFAENRFLQSEHYFIARVGDVVVDDSRWTEFERRAFIEHRWWHVSELQRTGETIIPEELADFVREYLEHHSR